MISLTVTHILKGHPVLMFQTPQFDRRASEIPGNLGTPARNRHSNNCTAPNEYDHESRSHENGDACGLR